MRIVFAGSGEFGLPSLKAIRAAGHEVVQVFTQPDRPAGRGRKVTATPIGGYADGEKLAIKRTENINAEMLPECDVMVVIAFGQKIAPQVVNHPKFGSVNLHASQLPKYRGAAPIHWAILGGETVTGNSIIRLAERMDAGAVLAQSSLEIGELETTGELHDRLAEDGAGLMIDVLRRLENGTAVEKSQDESLATVAKKLNREVSKIDFSRGALEIARKIRGMYPWPGCRIRVMEAEREVARVTLVRARALNRGPHAGRLSGEIGEAGYVGCAEGAVEIVELQPEGKRPMSLREFQNGHPWKPGMRLEAVG